MKQTWTYIALASLALCILLVPRLAHAEARGVYRSGFDVQSFKEGSSITQGLMLGYRGLMYLDSADPYYGKSNLAAGFELHAGSRMGGRLENDNLTYGGVSLATDGTFDRIFCFDLGLMLGYAYGNLNGVTGRGLAIQPTVGLGVVMVSGWRATFTSGYLFTQAGNGFSGFTFGVRLDRKTFETSQGLDH